MKSNRNFDHLPTHDEFVNVIRETYENMNQRSAHTLYRILQEKYLLPPEWKGVYRSSPSYYRADFYAYTKHFSATTWAKIADIDVYLLDVCFFCSPLYRKKDSFLLEMYSSSDKLIECGADMIINGSPYTFVLRHLHIFQRLYKKCNQLTTRVVLFT